MKWQVEVDGTWMNIVAEEARQLEEHFRRGQRSFKIQNNGQIYDVSLQGAQWVRMNLNTGKARAIRLAQATGAATPNAPAEAHRGPAQSMKVLPSPSGTPSRAMQAPAHMQAPPSALKGAAPPPKTPLAAMKAPPSSKELPLSTLQAFWANMMAPAADAQTPSRQDNGLQRPTTEMPTTSRPMSRPEAEMPTVEVAGAARARAMSAGGPRGAMKALDKTTQMRMASTGKPLGGTAKVHNAASSASPPEVLWDMGGMEQCVGSLLGVAPLWNAWNLGLSEAGLKPVAEKPKPAVAEKPTAALKPTAADKPTAATPTAAENPAAVAAEAAATGLEGSSASACMGPDGFLGGVRKLVDNFVGSSGPEPAMLAKPPVRALARAPPSRDAAEQLRATSGQAGQPKAGGEVSGPEAGTAMGIMSLCVMPGRISDGSETKSQAAAAAPDKPAGGPTAKTSEKAPPSEKLSEVDHQTPQGQRRAVLIGINYFGTSIQLGNCLNDVENIHNLLTESCGWSPKSIRTLTDDPSNSPEKKPTWQNIHNTLRWLADGAQSGDALFLFFSGHAAQQKDPLGYSKDGMSGTLLPSDFQQAGMMTNDHIAEVVARHLPEGVRLTVVADCCHGGFGLELPFKCTPQGWQEEANPYFSMADLELFSCSEVQAPAKDTTFLRYSARRGALTSVFCDVLRSHPQTSYLDLMGNLHQTMQAHCVHQRPRLSSSQRFGPNRAFSLLQAVPNSNARLGRVVRQRFEPQPKCLKGPLADMLGLGERTTVAKEAGAAGEPCNHMCV